MADGYNPSANTTKLFLQNMDETAKKEDDYLKWQQDTLQQLAQSPAASEEDRRAMLHDMADIMHSRNTDRPRAPGVKGWLGHTMMPTSPYLQHLLEPGSPMGPSMQDQMVQPAPAAAQGQPAPQPTGPNAVRDAAFKQSLPAAAAPPGMGGPVQTGEMSDALGVPVAPGAAPTGGKSVLQNAQAIPMPGQGPAGAMSPSASAAGMVSAGREMQSGPQQGPVVVPPSPPPLYQGDPRLRILSPTANAQAAGAIDATKDFSKKTQEWQLLEPMLRQMGVSEPDIQRLRLENFGGASIIRAQAMKNMMLGTAQVDGAEGVPVGIDQPTGRYFRNDTGEEIKGVGRVIGFKPFAKGGAGGIAPEALWDQKAVDQAIEQMAQGINVNFGFGTAGQANQKLVRDTIRDREIASGVPFDQASIKANLKVDTVDLQQSVTQRQALEAFSKTAEASLGPMFDALKDLGPTLTRAPLLNQPLQALISQTGFNEKQQAALSRLQAAKAIIEREYARITSDPTLSHDLKESDKEAMAQALPNGATPRQILNAVAVYLQDTAARKSAITDRINQAQYRISARGNPSAVPPPPTPVPQYKMVPDTNAAGAPNPNAGMLAIQRGDRWQLWHVGIEQEK